MARRFLSVPGFYLLGIALVVLLPIWLPITLLVDLFTAPRRLPPPQSRAAMTW